jgi:hypothetical protein
MHIQKIVGRKFLEKNNGGCFADFLDTGASNKSLVFVGEGKILREGKVKYVDVYFQNNNSK